MSAQEDPHLQALFADHPELPGSARLLESIDRGVQSIEARQRWRRRLLLAFALAGLSLPVMALSLWGPSLWEALGAPGLAIPAPRISGALVEARPWSMAALATIGLAALASAASWQALRR